MAPRPIPFGIPRRTAASGRARALVLACAALLVVASCGEDSPAGPVHAPPIDATRLIAFVNDPFVRQLPGLLQDQTAAAAIHDALTALSKTAERGELESIRRSLLTSRRSVETYRARARESAGDPTILEVLDLILFQAELLLDARPHSGTPVIELR